MSVSPLLGELCLSEHVAIVVRPEAREAPIGGHSLEMTVQPSVLLIKWIQLDTVTGCNCVAVFDSRRPNLCL